MRILFTKTQQEVAAELNGRIGPTRWGALSAVIVIHDTDWGNRGDYER
jgi:hypothetical protein